MAAAGIMSVCQCNVVQGMLIPAFQLQLGHPVQQGSACVGYFDGKHPAFTAPTISGKILVHNPHARSAEYANDLKFLNINRSVTALCAGPIDAGLQRDVLLIGTQTNLQAYDVEENRDIFYKEVADGVNAMVFGFVGNVESPMAVGCPSCAAAPRGSLPVGSLPAGSLPAAAARVYSLPAPLYGFATSLPELTTPLPGDRRELQHTGI